MLVTNHSDISTELIEDFYYDFTTSYESAESALIELEHSPDNVELARDLFRSVHTIKGNFIYIGLRDLCPLLQSVEDVLELLRNGELHYDDLLSDIVLVALDKTKLLINENLYDTPSGIDLALFEQMSQSISQIATIAESQRTLAIHNALKILAPTIQLPPLEEAKQKSQSQLDDFVEWLNIFGIDITSDLAFINQLTPALEARSSYWFGRSYRITQLCLNMNDIAGKPINPTQLTMAALTHDLSMAFLPIEILHKEKPLNSHEKKMMHSHVRLSHDLLAKMGNWDEAIEMVSHHHERCNGSGYPKGLRSAEICPGAKIIAIADTFDACRFARAYRLEQERPLVRAVLEINRLSGDEFDEFWVDIFNQAAKLHFTQK